MNAILENWTDAHSQGFCKKPMTVQHRLEDTGMFSDEALAALIERHPTHLIDVCTMGVDVQKPNAFRTGDFRGLSGAELIRAARDGQIWINLRKVTNHHNDYGALLGQALGEVKSHVPGFKVFGPSGGILISSPKTRVPYHSDQTITMLWHIRGTKRFYIYPDTEKFLPDQAFESIILGESTEDVPFRAEFENDAQELVLTPGTLATWPLNGPHRVENDTFCVSMTVECPTAQSLIKNSIVYTNGILRRKYGRSPSYARSGFFERTLKAGLGIILRRIKYRPTAEVGDFVTFKVDMAAADCILDVAPFKRTY